MFNRVTFTKEAEREISVKVICGSLKESFVNDKILEMTNERIYTSSVSHDRSGRISHHQRSQEMRRERPRTNKYRIEKIKTSNRKRQNFDEFMYYDD